MSSKEQNEIEDFGIEVEGSDPRIRDLSPRDKLQFAKWVLRGIFAFAVVTIAVSIYQAALGETLMEICKTGLLPIASFVIGDYFGSRDR